MDELEFRRRLYSDPNSSEQEIIDAINSDTKRKQFSDELKSFDNQISNAMNVDVPDNLAEKLILRQSLHSHQQTKKKSRIHLAMAASVAMFVGIGASFIMTSSVYTNVADYSLAHYHHEADKFSNTGSSDYTLASFNQSVTDLNVSFSDKLGKLISSDECYFDGMNSMHLVFEGLVDNVTIFIVPKNEHLKYQTSFNEGNIHGITHQYKGGDVIIMGNKNEPLEHWQQKINDTIKWSI